MKRLSEKEFREYSLSGNLYKLIVQVGTPLAVFAVFNSLFSILDTMMASHLGTIDVSTVAYGAGDNEKANMLMNTLIRLILILSAIFLSLIPLIP